MSTALSVDEFMAQCFVFFIGGYDTVTTTISMAAYCLAINQEAQDNLYEEAKQVFAQQVRSSITFCHNKWI